MFPARYFKKDGHGVKIVGVAKNEDDAKELVGSIISSIIKEKGDISCDTVKEFFKS